MKKKTRQINMGLYQRKRSDMKCLVVVVSVVLCCFCCF